MDRCFGTRRVIGAGLLITYCLAPLGESPKTASVTYFCILIAPT